jgi:hypothetical protein
MGAIGLRLLAGLPRQGHQAGNEPAGYTARETLLLLVAAVAVTGGLIHIGAAVDHFDEFPLYTLVFSLLACAQIGWAAMLIRRCTDRVLLFGCVFNLGIIALWLASRTIGVPIAPQAWVPETVGVADLIETVGEGVTVIALLSLMLSDHHAWARAATRRMPGVLLLMLLMSVLYGSGAHAG